MNVGKMMLGLPTYLPATPFGIIQLLERYNIETEGKHCVVLGRSHIVGSPISVLLSRKANPGNCTVTLCHSKTRNIKKIAKSADILIVAMGQPKFVTHEMVKKGAVVIDVGIHRVPSEETKSGFRLVGDVDFAKIAEGMGARGICVDRRDSLEDALHQSHKDTVPTVIDVAVDPEASYIPASDTLPL